MPSGHTPARTGAQQDLYVIISGRGGETSQGHARYLSRGESCSRASVCEAQNSFDLHAVVWGNHTTSLLSGHQSRTWTNTETRPTRPTSRRALEEHRQLYGLSFFSFSRIDGNAAIYPSFVCLHTRAVLSVARLLLLAVSIAGGLRVVKRRAAAESSPHPHIIYVVETRFTALGPAGPLTPCPTW